MRSCLTACLIALLATVARGADFTQDVKPILVKHCVSCHGPEKQRASLRLDSVAAILEGGSSGPAVVPGQSARSLLVHAVLGSDGAKLMPPKGPRLADAEVAVLRRWIDAGAKRPANEVIAAARTQSSHWAFQPVRRPQPPASGLQWARTPIDCFIYDRLRRENLQPSPEADRVTLIRRLHLDLIGLPPSPQEVAAFVADRRPNAYERLVDRLLASPHYGERWGRHWLDQARYADSNGYSIDSARSIWKYRDWVIAALNADMPFDQFTIEQLAGDLLPNATQEQRIATGFHRNTQINEEGGIDPEQFRVEAVVDRVNTTGAVWMGLTLGCAQCHDHKYDPISQKEYYQIYAFFNNSDDPKLDLLTPEAMRLRADRQRQLEALLAQRKQLDGLSEQTLQAWEGSLSVEARKSLPAAVQTVLALAPNGRTPRQQELLWAAYQKADQVRHVTAGLAGPWALASQTAWLVRRQSLQRQIDTLNKQVPAALTTLVLNERKMPRPTFIHLGGDFLRKGARVSPGTLAVLPPLPGSEAVAAKGKPPTRLDLAHWLVDGKHPLTGRVLVNRLWQQFFGVGLVETENDFGTQGTKPSHPELLDWLADEVVRVNWSLKQMHRLIVTSAVYRQSSQQRADLQARDPRNLLWGRQNRLRLEAEVVRDVALAASGLLTTTIGGPSVFPPQPEGVYSLTQIPKNWVASVGPDRYRRGLYTFFWRSAPHPGLTVFDAPDGTTTCTRRNRSNTPLQALTLLNDTAYLECARALANRLLTGEESDEERIERAFRLTVSRSPSSRERQVLSNLLARQRQTLSGDLAQVKALVGDTMTNHATEQAVWVQLSRVLLNVDEFITRE